LGKPATALLTTIAALAGTIVATAPAGAQMPAAAPATGGAPAAAPPVISGVTCRAACTGLQDAAAGSVVRLAGQGLAGATTIVFAGGRGGRDDVLATPAETADDHADVIVPATARSGPLRAVGAGGRWSRLSTQRVVLGPGGRRRAGAPLVQAHVDSKRVFLDGHSRPSVSFYVGGGEPTQVRVDLLRDGLPTPVASWTPDPVAAGSVGTVAWDGALGPVAPPEGRYVFQVTALAGGVVTAAASRPRTADAPAAGAPAAVTSGFLLLAHAFPVRGPHTIGMLPTQRFGAGRAGHVHQGQDVFAACGTPLVAVHGGTIRYKAFQAAAGNYVVLREDGGADYAYMHLRDPALVERGARVSTGQLLGYVGDTGDADGCHLHFEKWPSPGWYTGGAPVDPLADLQAWDRTS
jgi:murein DD-endopeptidase MepM/ murein hydrolase activator NlpD